MWPWLADPNRLGPSAVLQRVWGCLRETTVQHEGVLITAWTWADVPGAALTFPLHRWWVCKWRNNIRWSRYPPLLACTLPSGALLPLEVRLSPSLLPSSIFHVLSFLRSYLSVTSFKCLLNAQLLPFSSRETGGQTEGSGLSSRAAVSGKQNAFGFSSVLCRRCRLTFALAIW